MYFHIKSQTWAACWLVIYLFIAVEYSITF